MAERLINSKCESKAAVAVEIAALPIDIRHLVDDLKSEAVGYPAMFVRIQSGARETYSCIDAKLLEASCKSKSDLRTFITTEIMAHVEGLVQELVSPELVDG